MSEDSWKLPRYPLPRKAVGEGEHVYDPIRKDWYVLQPEEEVRQHLLLWLMEEKKISPNLISVEKEISYRGTRRRFDVVVFDRDGRPWLLCECKAPQVGISQDTINQIARYNQALQAPHLLITNGLGLVVFSQEPDGRFRLNKAW
ncbi:MAG: type I restriction enzyme HsdR N-terminal domain-containing protein [Bacteroidia bacterium]|nr:type I restriction enzyme HsdR N-terminal domain-containing protein [Bacteroidia bacterium]